ncbi:hypothetical protein [Arsukibacterium ikkense]|uniref:hypothetical protein n=1 Tax=Arsukibacterium ikkense TaxID=336831 RepID=UPI000A5B9BC1|nr:hypothetical protein [Arsukibacterium ikkense]
MLKLFACILLCLLIASCSLNSSNSSHQLTGQVRAATSSSAVVVYNEAPAQFTEIAIVSARSIGSTVAGKQSKQDEVINALISEAAALGANGVVLTKFEEEAVKERVSSFDGVQSSVRDVIKYYHNAQGLAVFVD